MASVVEPDTVDRDEISLATGGADTINPIGAAATSETVAGVAGGHIGGWHSTYSDCGARCAWHLGVKNLGKQHWSCCYQTDQSNGTCLKNTTTTERTHPTPEPLQPPRPSPHHTTQSDVPRFVIHLDAPPSERWTQVCDVFRDRILALTNEVDDILGSKVASVGSALFSGLTKMGGVLYSEELKAISKQCDVPLGRLAMMQLAYEVFACCTSVVWDQDSTRDNDNRGGPCHIRTMDWEMPLLQNMAFEGDFRVANKTVFIGTTWAGYVGVLTGMRLDAFSVSINYRRIGSSVLDVMNNFVRGTTGCWPVGFLVREALADCTTYDEAVSALAHSSLMAPVYIILAGTETEQGVILSRGRKRDHNRLTLASTYPQSGEGEGEGEDTPADDSTLTSPRQVEDASEDITDVDVDPLRSAGVAARGALVQVNMDHWRENNVEDCQNICFSVPRRRLVRHMFHHLDASDRSLTDLWSMAHVPPVLADDNVYTVSMCPSTGEYTTQVRSTREERNEAAERWRVVADEVLRSPDVNYYGSVSEW